MTDNLIQIKNHQYKPDDLLKINSYKPDDLLKINSASIKVTHSGRRIYVKDNTDHEQKLKYNEILKAVLHSNCPQKTKLLSQLIKLKDTGHTSSDSLIVKMKRSWGKASQEKLVQEAKTFLAKAPSVPKKKEDLSSSSSSEAPPPQPPAPPAVVNQVKNKKNEGIFSEVFKSLNPDTLFSIFNHLPTGTPYEIEDTLQKMQWFSKSLDNPGILNSIPPDHFANWLQSRQLAPAKLFLKSDDPAILQPYLNPYYASKAVAEVTIKKNTLLTKEEAAAWFNIHQISSLQAKRPHLIPFLEKIEIREKTFSKAMALLEKVNPAIVKDLSITIANGIGKHTCASLKKFTNIETLALSGCRDIYGGLVDLLHSLPHLTSLSLAGISLNGDQFAGYLLPTHLKQLHLACYTLSDYGIEQLKKMTNLQVLSLKIIQDNKNLNQLFSHLPHLKELNLRGKKFSAKGWNCAFTTSLKKLDLSNYDKLNLTNLRKLNLSHSQFFNYQLAKLFQSYPHLQELNLSNTHVKGGVFRNCAFKDSLKSLDLSYTAVGKKSLIYLEQFVNLRRLKISFLSTEDQERLQKALPHCKITLVSR